MDLVISTIAVCTKNVALGIPDGNIPPWGLHILFPESGPSYKVSILYLSIFFALIFGFQGRLGNADEQVAPSSLPRYFWLIVFSSTTRWLDAGTENTLCNTWSTVCCLRRICSRVDRFWFRDSWSDCIAAAAEASTWLFSSSPSSWRTISESCTVFKSTSRSCGNTLNKDMNS